MNDLLDRLDRLHTTELGAERVKRNLRLETDDVVSWCRAQLLRGDIRVRRRGKNYYASADGWEITVNAHSYTVITAHRL